jgi:anti-sigma B factor antagonist
MRPGPDPGLTVDHTRSTETGRTAVHVGGELDMATAPLLLTEITALAAAGHLHVDFRLHRLTFCDGSGFSALLDGRRQLARRGGSVLLHDPCRSLRRILDIFDMTLGLETRGTDDDTMGAERPRA